MHTYMKTPTCVTFFTFTCTCIQTYVCTCTSSPIHEKMQGWHHQKKKISIHSFFFLAINAHTDSDTHAREEYQADGVQVRSTLTATRELHTTQQGWAQSDRRRNEPGILPSKASSEERAFRKKRRHFSCASSYLESTGGRFLALVLRDSTSADTNPVPHAITPSRITTQGHTR